MASYADATRTPHGDLSAQSVSCSALPSQHGRGTITFKGTFFDARMSEIYGRQIGDTFEVTVQATREGISQALRGLQ